MLRIKASVIALGATLITLSALALQAFTASQRHRETALALLGDYAGFAVFNYRERAVPRMQHLASLAVDPHHDPKLAEVFQRFGLDAPRAQPACDCERTPLPVAGYFVRLADGSLRLDNGIAHQAEAIRRVMTGYQPSARATLVPLGEGARFAALGLAHQERSDVVIGAVLEASAVNAALAEVLKMAKLLPPSLARGLPTDSLVELAVYAPAATLPIFTTGNNARWLAARSDTLPRESGGLVLRASVREAAAPHLIIGGLPRSRLPLLLVLLAISLGLGVLAGVQMRRERALIQMRERFVTSVSHELRTPLAQVRLFLETLRMGRASSTREREWALSHIERETTRLAHLVENVLHVSKPAQPARAAAPVIDAGAELEDIVESFRPLARSRRARLLTRLAPDLNIAMRREHLRQMMLNLLDNAVKYGPTDQTVTVDAWAAESDLIIAVSDEGAGVLPAEQERIWQPYFRGSTPEALASGGAGIGLSIVRDLAGQCGGNVRLGSAARGARFELRLPLTRVVADPARAEAAAQSG